MAWVKTVLDPIFGVGAPPVLVHFHGDWDVHWGYGILTHGHFLVEALSFPLVFRVASMFSGRFFRAGSAGGNWIWETGG